MIDDNWEQIENGYNDYSGWISNPGMPQSFTIDLQADKEFKEIGIVNAGDIGLVNSLVASGNNNARNYQNFNTKNMKISISENKIDWQEIKNITNNQAGRINIQLPEKVTARYVKVEILTGQQTGTISSQRARVAKMYLFASPGYTLPIDSGSPQATQQASETKPLKAANTAFQEKMDIAKAEINTEMTIGSAPVSINNWLSAENNIMVTTVESKAKTDQAIEINPWAKNTVAYQTPANGDNTKASKPETTTKSGVSGDVTWVSRRSNINDDIVTPKGKTKQEKYQAGFMSEFAIATKILGGKGSVDAEDNTGKIYTVLPAGKKITIVSAINTVGDQKIDAPNGKDGKAVQGAVKSLESFNTETSIAKERQKTLDWWKNYYLQSYVDTGNTKLNKTYYGSQYIFGSATRAGKTAPGLYGPWITTDQANWQGDYHLNYNFQAPYYGSYSSNRLLEFSEPMFYEAIRYMNTGIKRASDPAELESISPWYYSTRKDENAFKNGFNDSLLFTVGIVPYIDDKTKGSYLNQTIDALLLASQIGAYYEYTQDDEWMFTKIETPNGTYSPYDFLTKVGNFYKIWLEKRNPRIDQEYIKDNPSGVKGNTLATKYTANYAKYPPYSGGKNYTYVLFDGSHESSFEFNPTVAVGNLQYLMDNLVTISKNNQLSESTYADWKDIATHLVKPETAIYEYNQATSWKTSSNYFGKEIFGLSEDRYVRPISATVELEFVMPGNQLGFDSESRLLEAGRNTVDVMGNDGSPGWASNNNTPKIFTQAARLQYDAATLRSKIITNVTNKMDKNYYVNDNTHGWEKAGIIESINNMMLQSSEGIMKLFPVWPENTNGEFRQIREKGAFLVSAKMTNNNISDMEITSEKGNDVKVVNPYQNEKVRVLNSKNKVIQVSYGTTKNSTQKESTSQEKKLEETVDFKTEAGETYRIIKATVEDNAKDALAAILKDINDPSKGFLVGTTATQIKAVEELINQLPASETKLKLLNTLATAQKNIGEKDPPSTEGNAAGIVEPSNGNGGGNTIIKENLTTKKPVATNTMKKNLPPTGDSGFIPVVAGGGIILATLGLIHRTYQ
ncbi:discoidin domain-containing protein [Listeria ivanovii]|nr:discoidin domain-containing protein [Listeria ivanovii]